WRLTMPRRDASVEIFTRADEPFKVARVAYGRHSGIGVYAFTRDDAGGYGLATVGLGGKLNDIALMKPETAEALAGALQRAAAVARGQSERPKMPMDLGLGAACRKASR